jgi:hypothetical protein
MRRNVARPILNFAREGRLGVQAEGLEGSRLGTRAHHDKDPRSPPCFITIATASRSSSENLGGWLPFC